MITEISSKELAGSLIAKSFGTVKFELQVKTMKAVTVLCLAFTCPISAFAGNIFGSLSEHYQPIKGAELTLTCGSSNYQARTGDDGSYSLRADQAGRCTLHVKYKDQTVETEVFSYNEPTRYDFELVRTAGKYELRKTR